MAKTNIIGMLKVADEKSKLFYDVPPYKYHNTPLPRIFCRRPCVFHIEKTSNSDIWRSFLCSATSVRQTP